MSGQPLFEYTLVRSAINPATITGGVTGNPIDRAADGGNQEAIVAVIIGVIGDGTYTFTVEDSDDGTSGWAAVPADELMGSFPTIGSGDDNKIFEVGVALTRRFIRVRVGVTGALTGGELAAVVVLGEMRFNPVTR